MSSHYFTFSLVLSKEKSLEIVTIDIAGRSLQLFYCG